MTIIGNEIEGVFTVDIEKYSDSRGSFTETFKADDYSKLLGGCDFVQDNLSVSKHRVLRGLHYQVEHPQGHLITLLDGEILDVGVDLRKKSATFGKWFGIYLKHSDCKQVFLPPGVAHGFMVVSQTDAKIHYKCTDYYCPGDEAGLNWKDEDISIIWPDIVPVINNRDKSLPCLKDIPENKFPNI